MLNSSILIRQAIVLKTAVKVGQSGAAAVFGIIESDRYSCLRPKATGYSK